jgi:putative oxidoreductase
MVPDLRAHRLGQWFRYFTGVVQVAGGLLLLTPWTLTLGAVLLAGTMVGAAIVDIFDIGAVGFALLPLILLGAVGAIWFAGSYGAAARR